MEGIFTGGLLKSMKKWKYVLGPLLGKGQSSKVYSGKRLSDQVDVAIKIIQDPYIGLLETQFLKRLTQVKGVIKYLDSFSCEDFFVLVMEHPQSSMDLFDYIAKHKVLNERQAQKIFRRVVDTILECHKVKILHGDIKDENILVNVNDLTVKLIDFGEGCDLNETVDYIGTRIYNPPEWFKNGTCDGDAATVWSLGTLLYTMVCGKEPFEEEEEILKGIVSFKNDKLSAKCKDLITKCLSVEISSRLGLKDILEHPWMNSAETTIFE